MAESKRVLIFAVVLLVVVSLGWYFVFYQPKASSIITLKEDSQRLLLKLKSLQVTDKRIATLENQIEKLQDQIDQHRTKIWPKSDMPRMVKQIEKQGRVFGLKFQSVIPEYDALMSLPDASRRKGDLLELTVHFKLQGSYKNFGRFVESLQKLPFVISLGEMSMVFNKELYPELEIMLDAVLYLRESSPVQQKS
ncbi:MAG: type 4a pilus biogenesis protein PilO [bacterium]